MIRVLALMLTATFGSALATTAAPVNGVSAEIYFLPATPPDPQHATYLVRLRIVNKGACLPGSEKQLEVHLRLLPADLHLRVVDEKGLETPSTPIWGDRYLLPGMSPFHPTAKLNLRSELGASFSGLSKTSRR